MLAPTPSRLRPQERALSALVVSGALWGWSRRLRAPVVAQRGWRCSLQVPVVTVAQRGLLRRLRAPAVVPPLQHPLLLAPALRGQYLGRLLQLLCGVCAASESRA